MIMEELSPLIKVLKNQRTYDVWKPIYVTDLDNVDIDSFCQNGMKLDQDPKALAKKLAITINKNNELRHFSMWLYAATCNELIVTKTLVSMSSSVETSAEQNRDDRHISQLRSNNKVCSSKVKYTQEVPPHSINTIPLIPHFNAHTWHLSDP